MLFSSIPFLFYFLPIFIACYFVTPKKLKNAVLLIFSLIFYAWGESGYVVIMACSITAGYFFGLLIDRFRGRWQSKVFLFANAAVCLGMLSYFKYTNFFIENVQAVTGISMPVLKIALPIGISFFTFQILSYDIDVYRGSVPVQKNFINLAAYIAMFPQLIAGPIVRYADIYKELDTRKHSFEKVSAGIRRFVVGLSKKVLLANSLSELCLIFRESGQPSVTFYWLYAVAFTLHIYFDFSGYSDMAIGLGKILGFDFLENFNYPYISASITEFWRRWHISLGSWFRDYVYIPLGGNRKGKLCWYRNILIVWLLTGIWHGASWNFVIWGLMFAVLLVVEKLFLLNGIKRFKIAGHVYTLLFVVIGFVIFNAESLSQMLGDLKGMFGLAGVPFMSVETGYHFFNYGGVILISVMSATPAIKLLLKKTKENDFGRLILSVAEPIALLVLLVMCTASLVDGSYNPFLYFRF